MVRAARWSSTKRIRFNLKQRYPRVRTATFLDGFWFPAIDLLPGIRRLVHHHAVLRLPSLGQITLQDRRKNDIAQIIAIEFQDQPLLFGRPPPTFGISRISAEARKFDNTFGTIPQTAARRKAGCLVPRVILPIRAANPPCEKHVHPSRGEKG